MLRLKLVESVWPESRASLPGSQHRCQAVLGHAQVYSPLGCHQPAELRSALGPGEDPELPRQTTAVRLLGGPHHGTDQVA
jgi:hypothetical protein